jgi:hypothetical protein
MMTSLVRSLGGWRITAGALLIVVVTAMTGIFTPAYPVSYLTGSDGVATGPAAAAPGGGVGAPASPRPAQATTPRRHDHPDGPNLRWGIDATMAWTRSDGWVWVFACIDHYTAEPGRTCGKVGDRFAALQPVHDAVIDRWGRLDADA